MVLSIGTGPLASTTDGVLDPPLVGPTTFVQPYLRRVRAYAGSDLLVDTEDAQMLHAPDRHASLWLPVAAVAPTLLQRTRVWAAQGVPALVGYVHVPFGAVDRWFVEDEAVYADFKDPYHRVDVYASCRHVEVRAGGRVVAVSGRTKVLYETGRLTRYYLPWLDVDRSAFTRSSTVSLCPYKGDGQHWHVEDDAGGVVEDAAWSLPRPLPEGFAAAEHVAFYREKVQIRVDGVLLAS